MEKPQRNILRSPRGLKASRIKSGAGDIVVIDVNCLLRDEDGKSCQRWSRMVVIHSRTLEVLENPFERDLRGLKALRVELVAGYIVEAVVEEPLKRARAEWRVEKAYLSRSIAESA